MHDLSLLAIENKIPIIITNGIRNYNDTEKEILEKRQSPTMTIDDKIEFEKFKKIKNINSISSKENQSSFFEEVRIAFSSLFRLLH